MRNLLLGSLFLALAGSIWGAMFIAVRWSIFVIPPVPLVWMRYGTALFALMLLAVTLLLWPRGAPEKFRLRLQQARRDLTLPVLSVYVHDTLRLDPVAVGLVIGQQKRQFINPVTAARQHNFAQLLRVKSLLVLRRQRQLKAHAPIQREHRQLACL